MIMWRVMYIKIFVMYENVMYEKNHFVFCYFLQFI